MHNQGRLATIIEYFDYLLNRVTVRFKPKNDPQSAGFELTMSKKMTYDQVSQKVAEHLCADPMRIRFTTADLDTQAPKSIYRRNARALLKEMIPSSYAPHPLNLLYYEVLDISILDLETNKIYIRG